MFVICTALISIYTIIISCSVFLYSGFVKLCTFFFVVHFLSKWTFWYGNIHSNIQMKVFTHPVDRDRVGTKIHGVPKNEI